MKETELCLKDIKKSLEQVKAEYSRKEAELGATKIKVETYASEKVIHSNFRKAYRTQLRFSTPCAKKAKKRLKQETATSKLLGKLPKTRTEKE
jgi:hypothetical protein